MRAFSERFVKTSMLSRGFQKFPESVLVEESILMPAAFEAADTKKFVTTLVKQKINYHE